MELELGMTPEQFSSLPKYAQNRIRGLMQEVKLLSDRMKRVETKSTKMRLLDVLAYSRFGSDATAEYIDDDTEISVLHDRQGEIRIQNRPVDIRDADGERVLTIRTMRGRLRVEPESANVIRVWSEG